MLFDGKVVKGAPFSATAVSETVQTLADGTKLTHRTTALLYRDSQGRTRREQRLERIGPFAIAGEPVQLIFLHDPVAGVRYVLNAGSREARKFTLPAGGPPAAPPPPVAAGKTETLGL
jgi:hypothetical protein